MNVPTPPAGRRPHLFALALAAKWHGPAVAAELTPPALHGGLNQGFTNVVEIQPTRGIIA